jgi:CAAX protease family protein
MTNSYSVAYTFESITNKISHPKGIRNDKLLITQYVFYYFSSMWKILKLEFRNLSSELHKLDSKTVTIFLSSTILLTISWYFSNPKFFNEAFVFHQSFSLIIEDLISFSYWFLTDSILFLVIPFFIVSLLFREKICSYGISFGKGNIGFPITVVSIFIFIPIIYFISYSEKFVSYFPLMESAKNDLAIFIIYEFLFLLFLFSWEFIFRGFILFGLEKKFGLYSIFIQMIPFVLLHNGKPFLETFASIYGAIFLGYLALRTRSIYYGFLIHAFILLSLDLIAYFKA